MIVAGILSIASSIISFLSSSDIELRYSSILFFNSKFSLLTAIDTEVSVKSTSNPFPSSNSTYVKSGLVATIPAATGNSAVTASTNSLFNCITIAG